MAEAFVRGPLYSWLRDMLGQIFGHFYVFKVFMGLPQERAEGAEGQAEAEVFEADRAFKHGDAVQVIRVVPGEVTACFYGKGVAVAGAPRFFHDHIVIFAFREGDEVARFPCHLFDDVFGILQFVTHAGPVKAGQGLMADGVGPEFHAVGGHFLDLVPGQVARRIHEVDDQEYGTAHVVFLQDGIGVFIVVDVAVIKGDEDWPVRQVAFAAHVGIELFQRNGMVIVVVQIFHLFVKVSRLHGQHGVEFIIDLMVVQDRDACQVIVRRPEIPKSKDTDKEDQDGENDADDPRAYFLQHKTSFILLRFSGS